MVYQPTERASSRIWQGDSQIPFLAIQPKLNLAVDISNYADELTSETFEVWKAEGVKRVIVRASTESQEKIDIARQQMQAVVKAGLELQAYIWLYFEEGLPPADQIFKALAAYGTFPVSCWWLDCEDVVQHGLEVVPWIVEAVAVLEDCSVGVYTSRGWWTDKAYNSDAFKHLPLWDADYDNIADLDSFTPYGGWTRPAMKQYTADVSLGYVNVDLNVYEEA